MSTVKSAHPLTFELAGPGDDAALRRLLHETPMGGSIELAFLREPSFFAASRMQGPFVQVLAARRGERVVGVATRAVRPAFVDGERRDVGYLGDLRLHPESRGTLALVRGYRFLRSLHDDGRAELYTTVIVADNHTALSTLAANRADLPRYTDLGRVVTPMVVLGRRRRVGAARNTQIERGSPETLPEIVDKLGENRLQFAPVYRSQDFTGGRFPGFRVEDFFLLRRRGRLAGVAGVWDPSSVRQTVVCGYSGWLRRLRPAINLVRRPPLPEPGTRLRFFFLAFVATDDVEAYRDLVQHVAQVYAGGEHSHFTTGLHEDDPRRRVLDTYRSTAFAGRLFLVTFGEPPRLDGRLPHVEAALL